MENEVVEPVGDAVKPAWSIPSVSFGSLWKASWATLKGNWGKAIGATLSALGILFVAMSIPGVGSFAQLLLSPMMFGVTLFFLLLVYRANPTVGIIFRPFNQYGRYLWTYLRPNIFIFLWALLLIVPGIIAMFRYFLTMYIVLENPDMSVKDAMTTSGALMKGYKFTAWAYSIAVGFIVALGGMVTLGIGLIWLIPWAWSFFANFYLAVKHAPRM